VISEQGSEKLWQIVIIYFYNFPNPLLV